MAANVIAANTIVGSNAWQESGSYMPDFLSVAFDIIIRRCG